MKKMHARETVGELEEIYSEGGKSQSTQEEPEQEPDEVDDLVPAPDPSAVDGIAESDNDEEEEQDEADDAHAEERQAMDVDQEEDAPDTSYPSVEEYKRKWDRQLAQHSRAVPGEFTHSNLVPECVPELWQNVPTWPSTN